MTHITIENVCQSLSTSWSLAVQYDDAQHWHLVWSMTLGIYRLLDTLGQLDEAIENDVTFLMKFATFREMEKWKLPEIMK